MLPYPWDFPGKNTGVGCHFFLQGIFPAQGLNPCLLHRQELSFPLSHQEGPFSYLTSLSKFDNFHTDIFNPLELLCFSCHMGVAFLPQNFFNIILYLKLAKKNTKNFNIALTQVSILLYLSVSGLSLSIPTDTHRDIHTLTYYLSEPFEDNLHTK